jgi:adenine phosphoribosyltransferase
MNHKMFIAGLERELPLCKVKDDLYIAAFIMFNDVEMTVACAEQLLAKAPDFDVIITAESKGIPLAYEMARQSGKPYIVARKGGKLYMQDIEVVAVNSITTEDLQILCLGRDEREVLQDKRVLVVDDVVSTGESLNAIIKLVDTVGGNVVGCMTVLAEGDAMDRDDIIYLEPLPLFNSDGSIKL